MALIDGIIGFISPKMQAKRTQYRLLNSVLEDQARKYNAATSGRRTDSWTAGGTSQNAENEVALEKLRARSRDLARNNPYGRRAVKAIGTNTIGAGIRPKVQEKFKGSEAIFSAVWEDWAESKECDFDGIHNFYGLQRLAMRTVAESGEALVRKRKTGKYGLQLQVVEGDFIDSSRTFNLADGGYIIQGVEFNNKGKKVAYWMFEQHPGDTFMIMPVSKRIPISEFAHIYFVERPGQVRGLPFGTSSMMRLFDFDEYEDAQLMRQKVAACFAAFVTSSGDGMPVGSKQVDQAGRVEPGIIEYLAPGQSVTFGNPPAAEGYDVYTKTIMRGIAMGYDTSYEVLTGDYSNVNFSSGRMGWIEFHRSVQEWQSQMMIPMFCDTTTEWFINNLTILGKLDSPIKLSWTPPRREMIDPVKEITAMSEAVRNGFKSWPEAIREMGYDPDQVLAEIEAMNKKWDAAGVKLDCDGRIDAMAKIQKALKGDSTAK